MQNQKMNPWMISTLVLVGMMVGFGVSQIPALKQIGNAGKTAAVEDTKIEEIQTPPQKTILTADQIAALPDDDAVYGDENAPITMVEFSDFQCPYCQRFFLQTLPQIAENYIETGKVKFIYRDYLIDGHNQAPYAALAAQCANDEGKFFEMHDELFINQPEWSGNEKALEIMAGYAKKIGLNASAYKKCMDEKKYSDEIKKDVIDGITLGITGTPGFFINGKEVSGAMPYELVFKPILDAELEGKEWELQFDARGGVSVRVF